MQTITKTNVWGWLDVGGIWLVVQVWHSQFIMFTYVAGDQGTKLSMVPFNLRKIHCFYHYCMCLCVEVVR